MSGNFLYTQPELLILLVLLGVFLFAGEVGFRIARRTRPAQHESLRAQVGNIEGALLALFALLLGFTFSMALSRFDGRKLMVIKEANAIGTAALRAGLLPDPQRAEVAELFRRYVDARLETVRLPNLVTPEQQGLDAEAMRIQDRLWAAASAAAAADPKSIQAGLLVQSMNEVIDVKGERDGGLANHVPGTVLILLFLYAWLALGVVGYANGLADARVPVVTAILAVLVAVVLLVVLDLDRPRRGLIRISQQSMSDLQKSLAAEK